MRSANTSLRWRSASNIGSENDLLLSPVLLTDGGGVPPFPIWVFAQLPQGVPKVLSQSGHQVRLPTRTTISQCTGQYQGETTTPVTLVPTTARLLPILVQSVNL
jgi:hypothetical protein